MNMASAIEGRAAGVPRRTEASRIAGVQVFQSMRDAEAVWRRLDDAGHLFTPFQRFDFLAAWQRHVGEINGLKPFIVVAYDAKQQPLLLLPLAVKRQGGVRIARFMGGKHSTFNMAVCQRDYAASATKADMDALLKAIAAHASTIDVLALKQQPLRWLDLPNPMALLPNQPSANDCPLMSMIPDQPPVSRISNSFRRRLKGKERKLQALPGYRYCLATSEHEVKRLIDAFFTIKPKRMAAQKLPNVFADPGVESFIRDACMAPLPSGGHAIEIHALECDDEVIAIFAGVADGHRFSMMFNTYTMSESSRYSPGLILMRDIIDHYAERGYTSLDLGIGSDDYKRLFCKGDEMIFDSFLPLGLRGRIAASMLSLSTHAKRRVKNTPALMQMAHKVRSVLHG